MTALFKRIFDLKVERGLRWEEVAKGAKIRMGSWMCGIPVGKPTDEELRKLADFFGVGFERLKNGD